MILTCPSCSASYNVPIEAIGVEGRTVRCKKCKHEWFQEGEKKALDDLINLVQSSDDHLDDLAFQDRQRKAIAAEAKAKTEISVAEKLSAIIDKIIPPKVKNYLFSGPKQSLLSHCASFMVALAVVSCLVLILVTGRWGITRVIPSLAPVYEANGFPLVGYARINPEEALIIDRVTLQTEEGKREITGNLINLTSENIKVPAFKLAYLDEKGEVLHEAKEILPIAIIKKEVGFNFNIPVSKDIPADFHSVIISFAE